MDDQTMARGRSGPDERLLIEAAQRDPSRFAELYDANFERVYAFIVRRVRVRHEAQDITSDVFHQALANLKRFEWRGKPFAAWLYRIASNAIADHYQRAARETGSHADSQGANERADEKPGDRADDRIAEIEQRASLFRLVDRLPADQRRVIVMRFAEERSIREIAEQFGRTEGAIKQLQWRGLQALRTQMGQNNG
ncbi:MAG TPA: RNA polymerase sigma factor [Thermoanaerobaculia bacterium]|nr:RNA polymerase sigma factor [Thermoanaerobaculia bacterium]